MKRKTVIGFSLFMIWTAGAAAQSSQPSNYPPSMPKENHRVTDIGRTTMADLELQRSGRSSVKSIAASQETAIRIYDRYLKSFTYDIPQEFKEDSFSSNEGR